MVKTHRSLSSGDRMNMHCSLVLLCLSLATAMGCSVPSDLTSGGDSLAGTRGADPPLSEAAAGGRPASAGSGGADDAGNAGNAGNGGVLEGSLGTGGQDVDPDVPKVSRGAS